MSSIPEPQRWLDRPQVKDGDRFHRWTVIESGPSTGRRPICRCECGTEKAVLVYDLLNGKTEGCLHCRSQRKQNSNYRHGLCPAGKQSKLYMVWSKIKDRCRNPKNKDWDRYGGRGIDLCEEWLDFSAFHQWAESNGYQEGLEIDRVSNDEGYRPDNCRVATHAQNCGNRGGRRSSIRVTIFGETKSLKEWSRDPRCLLTYQNLRLHFHRGDPLGQYFEDGEE